MWLVLLLLVVHVIGDSSTAFYCIIVIHVLFLCNIYTELWVLKQIYQEPGIKYQWRIYACTTQSSQGRRKRFNPIHRSQSNLFLKHKELSHREAWTGSHTFGIRSCRKSQRPSFICYSRGRDYLGALVGAGKNSGPTPCFLELSGSHAMQSSSLLQKAGKKHRTCARQA